MKVQMYAAVFSDEHDRILQPGEVVEVNDTIGQLWAKAEYCLPVDLSDTKIKKAKHEE